MHPPQRLHRYTMTHGGRQIIILAANDWAANDHAMLIFGHMGGFAPRREQQ